MKTPVLYCIFNRLDTVEKTFAPIRDAKPERLYISADGPRIDKECEKDLTEQVRRFVLDNIDWECDVKTLFREENLGCDFAISGAIEWFFSQEKEGIVIEDDILTSPQFFDFCELMLETYRDNPKIRYIAGYNPIPDKDSPESYYFVPQACIWGWAAWRRSFYPDNGVHYKYYPYNYYEKHCDTDAVLNRITDREDLRKRCFEIWFRVYQWDTEFYVYGSIYYPGSYAIIPNKTVTSHIGDYGYHFQGDNNGNIPLEDFDVSNLKIRDKIFNDEIFYEKYMNERFYNDLYKKYGRENIDVRAVKLDYFKSKFKIIKQIILFLYFKFIKFSHLRAKNQWDAIVHYCKGYREPLDSFYIYVTKYYNK